MTRRKHDRLRLKREGTSSKFLGVHRRSRKCGARWYSSIVIGAKCLHLGVHDSEVEAARAHDDAVRVLRLKRTVNFPAPYVVAALPAASPAIHASAAGSPYRWQRKLRKTSVASEAYDPRHEAMAVAKRLLATLTGA
jgi:hypothetical protein